MPKPDTCEIAVAKALRAEGWQVVTDKERRREQRAVYIDLRAFKDAQMTFIEVKCFPQGAIPDEQYTAIGQYLIYRTFLRLEALTYPLYLAVPVTIYEEEFDDVMKETLKEHHIWLLLFNEAGGRRLQWIEW